MNIVELEKVISEKADNLFKILSHKYELVDFESQNYEIEKEIYEVAKSYSHLIFFETGLCPDKNLLDEIKKSLFVRYEEHNVGRLNQSEMLAHWIKMEVIKKLEEIGVVFI